MTCWRDFTLIITAAVLAVTAMAAFGGTPAWAGPSPELARAARRAPDLRPFGEETREAEEELRSAIQETAESLQIPMPAPGEPLPETSLEESARRRLRYQDSALRLLTEELARDTPALRQLLRPALDRFVEARDEGYREANQARTESERLAALIQAAGERAILLDTLRQNRAGLQREQQARIAWLSRLSASAQEAYFEQLERNLRKSVERLQEEGTPESWEETARIYKEAVLMNEFAESSRELRERSARPKEYGIRIKRAVYLSALLAEVSTIFTAIHQRVSTDDFGPALLPTAVLAGVLFFTGDDIRPRTEALRAAQARHDQHPLTRLRRLVHARARLWNSRTLEGYFARIAPALCAPPKAEPGPPTRGPFR